MSLDVYQNKQIAAMLASAQAEVIQGAITHAMFWREDGRAKFISMCDEAFSSAVESIELLSKVLDDNDAKIAEVAKKETTMSTETTPMPDNVRLYFERRIFMDDDLLDMKNEAKEWLDSFTAAPKEDPTAKRLRLRECRDFNNVINRLCSCGGGDQENGCAACKVFHVIGDWLTVEAGTPKKGKAKP